MLKKTKIKYLLIFLSLGQAPTLSSMEQFFQNIFNQYYARQNEINEELINTFENFNSEVLPNLNVDPNEIIQNLFNQYNHQVPADIKARIQATILNNLPTLRSIPGFQHILNKFIPARPKIDPEIQRAIDDTNKILKELNIKNLSKQIQDEIKAEKLKEITQLVSKLKDQNTILLRFGSYLGFYKGDIVRAGCFALDLFFERLMYKKILEQKIEYVFEEIKKDSKILEKIVEKSEFSKKVNGINLLNFKITPEMREFKNYLVNKHKMINYNPFKQNLIPQLILNLLKSKVLKFIENSFSSSPQYFDFLNKQVQTAYLNAYQKDENGNLQRTRTPFSIVTVLMWILNPKYSLERSVISKLEIFKNTNKFFNLEVPNIIFSNSASILTSMATCGLALKFIDNILNNSWTDYVLMINQTRFLKLLQMYNKALNTDNTEEVQQIEKKLKKFITNGHSQAFSQLWLKAKSMSQNRIGFMLSLPVIGALSWKGYNFYKLNLASNR